MSTCTWTWTAPRVRGALERALRDALRSGRLLPGTRLPSSRALARDLGLARNTVAAAYAQLVAEGWLEGRQGAGTRVALHPASGPPAPSAPPPPRAPAVRPAARRARPHGLPAGRLARRGAPGAARRAVRRARLRRPARPRRAAPRARRVPRPGPRRRRLAGADRRLHRPRPGTVPGQGRACGTTWAAEEYGHAAHRRGLDAAPLPVDDDGAVVAEPRRRRRRAAHAGAPVPARRDALAAAPARGGRVGAVDRRARRRGRLRRRVPLRPPAGRRAAGARARARRLRRDRVEEPRARACASAGSSFPARCSSRCSRRGHTATGRARSTS